MSIRPTRVHAIVVAILVPTFVIPWTYAHITYSWDWKEQSTGEACTGRYCLTPYDKQQSMKLGTVSDRRLIYIGISEKVPMGRQIGSFGLSTYNDNGHFDFLGGAEGLHLGDTTTIEGVSTFTLKEVHSGIVWFTPDPEKATFYFDPDPTLTFHDFP